MNYRKIHDDIISFRKKNPIPKDEYGENHHIIPKCFGGLNTKDNLVRLSAREHFIVHLLLVRLYPKGSIERHKMLYAIKRLRYSKSSNNKPDITITSKLYEYHRSEFSNMMSKHMKELPRSDEWKSNISAAKIGNKHSEETVAKCSESTKEKWKDPTYREKQQKSKIGSKHTEERKAKIGLGRRGKLHSEETKAKIRATKAMRKTLKSIDT
jgi:hypothetical protein